MMENQSATNHRSNAGHASATTADVDTGRYKPPLHIAVLLPSYAESQGAFGAVDIDASPGYFFAPQWPNPAHPEQKEYAEATAFTFEKIYVEKRTAYGQIREAVKSKRFACFFNLCDGARDEDRAGLEVIQALEAFGVPFTGALSKHYEPTKTEMKMQLHCRGIFTPKGFVIRSLDDVRSQCAHLRFPVIVKHESGYGSVNMSKKSKCCTVEELEEVAKSFLDQFDAALVEEFIAGEEATVLACADPNSPDGIKVYPPVLMTFPQGEDFKHFDLKWVANDDLTWKAMDPTHRAYAKTIELGRVAFKHLMDGTGYGRSDVRIDRETGEAYFLELNPNCGIMYDYGQEGSADWILRLHGANGAGHREFIAAQINAAIERADAQRPTFEVTYSPKANAYTMAAARDLVVDQTVMTDLGTLQAVVNGKAAVLQAYDRKANCWQPITHSCDPTASVVAVGHTVMIRTLRDLRASDPLTLDFAAAKKFCDDFGVSKLVKAELPCHCGALACRGFVLPTVANAVFDCVSSEGVDELGAESDSNTGTDSESVSRPSPTASVQPNEAPPSFVAVPTVA